ncbi:MAG: hypothetical protein NUV84_05375 [Candidatus Uhrbacteria bacterium]|nr:hypothetical protein [Candidatus Uhrbacteria bacterium]
MKGIKKYTHKEREQVLLEMVPLIKQKFGKNLLAIAARGSFARKTEGPYSDLELFSFLKEMPRGQKKLPYAKMHKMRGGLSVELIWITEKTYINEVKEVSSSWFGVGSEKLLPVYNKPFVDKLSKHKAKDVKRKTLDQAFALWPSIFFSSSMVLDTADKKDHEKIAIALHGMFEKMLNFLAFINQAPYTSSSKKILESKKFKIKPKDFSKLTTFIVNGNFRKYPEIKKRVLSVTQEMKKYLEKAGYEPSEVLSSKKRSDKFGMIDKTKRYEQAIATWQKVQESTTKTLNAAEMKNAYGMVTVINDMFFQYLKILSCLNAKSLRWSQIMTDAKKLKYKPNGFPELITIIENGEYKSFSKIKKGVIQIFSELENRLEGMGYKLYQDNVDPNKND